MASHQICLIADRQEDRTGAPRSLCRNALIRALSVPPKGASLLMLSTGPVESPSMRPFCSPLPASVPFRMPSCFKTYSFCAFA
jgi:hypothetical protein